MNLALILCGMAALALVAFGRKPEEGEGIIETVTDYVDNWIIDEMEALNIPNVQAFLMLIRTGEGTAGANGYRMLFGGRLFDSFEDHPRITITASGYTSTAAGAYQFLSRTWDGLGLPDFSPANQDRGAVMLIRRRGALADVIAGRFRTAIRKCNKEWASLPESPYGQPTMTYQRAAVVLAKWGAQPSEAIA